MTFNNDPFNDFKCAAVSETNDICWQDHDKKSCS